MSPGRENRMKQVTLGSTQITVPQNGFGALPLQRVDLDTAVSILLRAYEGGMRFFDTAHAYSDSEEKLGAAFGNGIREHIFIATKSGAKTPEEMKAELMLSLERLKTDYIDIYQPHCVDQCYRPDDGTGIYEFLQEMKSTGKIRHIGITTHKLMIAEEIVESGLYETLQYPFSYLSTPREVELVKKCAAKNMGFICMKALAGGLINRADAAMAFMTQFDSLVPIWGIQKMSELEEWLAFMKETPEMNGGIRDYIEKEKQELSGDFCRGCGYCMPCPQGIQINQCARMSLMLRRAPSKNWLSDYWQAEMKKIETCLNCRKCTKKCPYELSTPELLKKNYEDYKKVLAGEVRVQ